MSRVFVEITEKRKVDIDGVEFDLKFAPPLIWKEIESELAIAGSGLKKPGEQISAESVGNLPADQYYKASEKLHLAYRRMVKFSVCGHKGISNKSGAEIPFKTNPDGTVSDETLDMYDLNKMILPIGFKVLQFNRLTEDEAKN